MDKFSFPVVIPARDDDQFEFGCVTTPGSPNTPADHLFANGKLLPHVFPIQTGPSSYYSLSRSASRASSVSSKDYSLVSSRSNSTNSSSSSARTSTSESASSFSGRGLSSNRLSARKERNAVRPGHRPVLGPQVYGSSQRWQLIAAAPVLKKQQTGSRSKVEVLDRKMSTKSRPVEDHGAAKTSWFGKRILKSFVSACKECHAITT